MQLFYILSTDIFLLFYIFTIFPSQIYTATI